MNMKYLPMIVGLTLSAAATPLLASATHDDDFARAMAASLETDTPPVPADDGDDLARAMAASLATSTAPAPAHTDDGDDLARALADSERAEMDRMFEAARVARERRNTNNLEQAIANSLGRDLSDDESADPELELEAALQLSLEIDAHAASGSEDVEASRLRATQDLEYATGALADNAREEERLQAELLELRAPLTSLDSEIDAAHRLASNHRARSEGLNNENARMLTAAETAEADVVRLRAQYDEELAAIDTTLIDARLAALARLKLEQEANLAAAQTTLERLNS